MTEYSVEDVTEEIVARLSGCDPIATGKALLELGLDGVTFSVVASEADLPIEPMHTVYRHWKSLPKVAGVADVLRIDPVALRPALGYLIMVDAGPGAHDFRYALYGSEIARVSGFEMTGRSVWESSTTLAIRTFLVAIYEAGKRLRRPLYTVHEAPPSITVSSWHRLILPMGSGGVVKRFLVYSLPISNGQIR